MSRTRAGLWSTWSEYVGMDGLSRGPRDLLEVDREVTRGGEGGSRRPEFPQMSCEHAGRSGRQHHKPPVVGSRMLSGVKDTMGPDVVDYRAPATRLGRSTLHPRLVLQSPADAPSRRLAMFRQHRASQGHRLYAAHEPSSSITRVHMHMSVAHRGRQHHKHPGVVGSRMLGCLLTSLFDAGDGGCGPCDGRPVSGFWIAGGSLPVGSVHDLCRPGREPPARMAGFYWQTASPVAANRPGGVPGHCTLRSKCLSGRIRIGPGEAGSLGALFGRGEIAQSTILRTSMDCRRRLGGVRRRGDHGLWDKRSACVMPAARRTASQRNTHPVPSKHYLPGRGQPLRALRLWF